MQLIKYIILLPIEFIRSFFELFSDKKLFKYSLLPFLLGFLSFIVVVTFGLFNLKTLHNFIFNDASTWYEYSYYSISFLLIIFTSTIISFIAITVASEFYLSKTLLHIFKKYKLKEYESTENSNFSIFHLIKTNLKVFIFFSISFLLLLIFSFFPLLIPLWFLLNSFLIGVELFNLPLEELKFDLDTKLSFIKNNKALITISGGVLFLSLLIPILNLIAIQVRIVFASRIIKKYYLKIK